MRTLAQTRHYGYPRASQRGRRGSAAIAAAAMVGAAMVCAALVGCSGTAPAVGSGSAVAVATASGAAGPAPIAHAVAAPALRPVDAPEDLAMRYRALSVAGGQVFALDPARSSVRIYAFRGGKAAQYGHNHVLSAPAFDGFFYLAPAGALESRFDLVFRLDQLVVDLPEHRAATGGSFASVISASATESTRDNMLGEFGLQAAQYPWVRIGSLQIAGEDPKFAAHIRVELHGQVREVWVPLQVSGLPQRLLVQGSTVLRQTDFGVKPFSVLGGLLSVQDPLVVEFSLQGAPVQP